MSYKVRMMPSGKLVDPFNITEDDIEITDIAHHLARICRWNGGVTGFYSVAEHSLRVAGKVPEELRLWALLHDAAEAYIGDIVRPIKRSLWYSKEHPHIGSPLSINDVEDRILNVLANKYGMTPPIPALVKKADDQQMQHEEDLIAQQKLNGNYPNLTEAQFLRAFHYLMGEPR